MSLRLQIILFVLAGLLVGGQPEGLIEELPSPEATWQESTLVNQTAVQATAVRWHPCRTR
ncbi:hypothetical protein DYH09_11105 [bacterium CPR1]|nr:hypothetical protein [bacterium CPR1]